MAIIIGQPKTIAEIKPLNEAEIAQMIGSVDPLLNLGQPLDMPALGMSILDYSRLIATIKKLSDELAELSGELALLKLPKVGEESRVDALLSRFKPLE